MLPCWLIANIDQRSSIFRFIELSVIHDTYIHSSRHSGEGRNPAYKITPRSGQSRVLDAVPLRGHLENCLDSGLRRNDRVAGLGVVANYGKLNNVARSVDIAEHPLENPQAKKQQIICAKKNDAAAALDLHSPGRAISCLITPPHESASIRAFPACTPASQSASAGMFSSKPAANNSTPGCLAVSGRFMPLSPAWRRR